MTQTANHNKCKDAQKEINKEFRRKNYLTFAVSLSSLIGRYFQFDFL